MTALSAMDWAKHLMLHDSKHQQIASSNIDSRHQDIYKSVSGHVTTMTSSSCSAEHRGGPVRTVSISRSGRYKSKSKQRARLLNSDPSATADVPDTLSSSTTKHQEQHQEPELLPQLAAECNGRFVSYSTDGSTFDHRPVAAPSSATNINNVTSSSSLVTPSGSAPRPLNDDDWTCLEVAFESTNL